MESCLYAFIGNYHRRNFNIISSGHLANCFSLTMTNARALIKDVNFIPFCICFKKNEQN